MHFVDAVGQEITIGNPRATEAWDRTVKAFLAHSAETPTHLGEVLEKAPNFALAWACKGLFYLLLGRSELVPTAREALKEARRAAELTNPSMRERAFIEALQAYLLGQPSLAAEMLGELVKIYPRDMLAVKLDQAIRFVLGDRKGMEQSMMAAMKGIDTGHPHWGYAQGCLAFAFEENGDYASAERCGRAGLEVCPDDAWGLHAVAHVYDMTARNDLGVAWLETRQEAWAHCNNFGFHVWWHLALFHLDRGDYDRVLELYDTRVRAEHTDDYRDISNGASMLVRLEIEGIDVGERWEELAALSAGRVEDGAVVFADLHYLMALNGGERSAAADALVARIAADAQRRDHDMHEVADLAGLPCAQGLAAFRAGDYHLAFDQLRKSRPLLQRVGGSHAQRDVFSRLLIEAGIRAGRLEEAEAETHARAARRGAEDNFTERRLAAIARQRAAPAVFDAFQTRA
ncbi:MAG: tetratricopeptide repeat protein [Pseudomonadota bacterium]